jgi:hypothetical protein
MRGKPAVRGSRRENDGSKDGVIALLEKRRRYNRDYMRRWRSDPTHIAREHEIRQQCYYGRKERAEKEKRPPFTNDQGEPVCGFCRKNAPVTQIIRLRVCEEAPEGYVEVGIPYCGEC